MTFPLRGFLRIGGFGLRVLDVQALDQRQIHVFSDAAGDAGIIADLRVVFEPPLRVRQIGPGFIDAPPKRDRPRQGLATHSRRSLRPACAAATQWRC